MVCAGCQGSVGPMLHLVQAGAASVHASFGEEGRERAPMTKRSPGRRRHASGTTSASRSMPLRCTRRLRQTTVASSGLRSWPRHARGAGAAPGNPGWHPTPGVFAGEVRAPASARPLQAACMSRHACLPRSCSGRSLGKSCSLCASGPPRTGCPGVMAPPRGSAAPGRLAPHPAGGAGCPSRSSACRSSVRSSAGAKCAACTAFGMTAARPGGRQARSSVFSLPVCDTQITCAAARASLPSRWSLLHHHPAMHKKLCTIRTAPTLLHRKRARVRQLEHLVPYLGLPGPSFRHRGRQHTGMK